MNGGSGHPGSPPADPARFRHDRAKSRGGASVRTGRDAGRTPTGLTPACGQAPHPHSGGNWDTCRHWPTEEPQDWERTAVNLTKRDNRDKNHAWRRLKAEDPASAAGLARDLPEITRVFGRVGIYVPTNFIEEGV